VGVTAYSIGQFARLGAVSVRMLRHYDEIGLLRPAAVDASSGYRSYSAEQVATLVRIVQLRDVGFSLPEIASIVGDGADLSRLLVARREQLVADLARTSSQLEQVERMITNSEENNVDTTSAVIEIRSLPAQLVAQRSAVAESFEPHHIGPVIQPLYPALTAAMEQAGVACAGPSTATYADSDDGRVRVTATIGIAARPSARVDFEVAELPAVEHAAVIVHRGSMKDGSIETSYRALQEWIATNGLTPIGYTREQDIECEDPEHWVVELQQPIEAPR
jgi:DNA-binding transcriptional MerR regulator